MPPVGFEPAIAEIRLSQIHAFDIAATAIGPLPFHVKNYWLYVGTQCVHVTVSQYCALTVRIHISTPVSIYLVCLAKPGAAALLDAE